MKVYVDSSVILRRILHQPDAMHDWSGWEHAVSSELLRVEALRALDRIRVRKGLPDLEIASKIEFLRHSLARFEQLPLQPSILDRAASAFPTAVGTLDAIHLATALVWTEEHEEPLVFLTHDVELGIAARACGFRVKTRP